MRQLWVALLIGACSTSPSAAPSMHATAVPTASLPPPTALPSPSHAAASSAPTPSPTPIAWETAWRTAFTAEGTLLGNVVLYADGFIATGCTTDDDGTCVRSLVLRSPDGVDWTATEAGMQFEYWTAQLQVVDGRLFAVTYGHFADGGGGAKVWTSNDGTSWSRVESASFRDRAVHDLVATPVGTFAFGIDAPVDSDNTGGFVAWPVRSDGTFGKARVIDVASGPALVDRVTWTGEEFLGWGGRYGPYGGPAIMIASPDGVAWRVRGTIPGAESFVNDTVGLGDRLIAVGHEGRHYPLTPRAWVSDDDGRSWTAATVEGNDARMVTVAPAAAGLIARGYESTDPSIRIASWESMDGAAWTRLPNDEDMPLVPGFQALTRATFGGLVCVAGSVPGETRSVGAIFCR